MPHRRQHDNEPVYREQLRSTRWEQRRQALRLLIVLDPPDLLDLLINALGDRARGVRRVASGALAGLGSPAYPALLARIEDAQSGPWCTVVLASTFAGRQALAALPEAGLAYLRRALALPDLHSGHLLHLTQALAIGPMPAVGDLLLPLLEHESIRVRAAAWRALVSRDERRLLAWAVAQTRWSVFTVPVVRWLGESGSIEAIAPLRRLCGLRAWLSVSAVVRAAAKAALAQVIESTRHIPDAALTHAAPPGTEPGAAALSLWAEEMAVDDEDDA
ncbi:MAG: HEAT repeat domain-containing protein [Armatimonadetes bacterium]|nr:HEAT repeat domain-containing protein [Armatimonadota bacterium]